MNSPTAPREPSLRQITPIECQFLGPASVLPGDAAGIYCNMLHYQGQPLQTIEAVVALPNDDAENGATSITVMEYIDGETSYHIHSAHEGNGEHLWFVRFQGPEHSAVALANVIVESTDLLEQVNYTANEGKRKARTATISAAGGGNTTS